MQSTERWRDTTSRLGASETEAKIKRPVERGEGETKRLGKQEEGVTHENACDSQSAHL